MTKEEGEKIINQNIQAEIWNSELKMLMRGRIRNIVNVLLNRIKELENRLENNQTKNGN